MRRAVLAFFTAAAIGIVASAPGCSSDNSSTGGTADSGADQSSADTGGSQDALGDSVSVSDTSTVDSSPTDAGDAADAPCPPLSTLHPAHADAGVTTLYCPVAGLDGGLCDPNSEHCCESSTGVGSCTANGTACAGSSVDWKCADPVSDCPGGQSCCGHGTFVKSTDPSCGSYATGFTGSACAASCTAGQIVMCTGDVDCPTNQHCIPFTTHGNEVGACGN